MNTITNNKIAIISDTHLGIHSDGELWHNIVITYAEWLKTELKKQDVSDIFILGDIFNNREEIGVKTLHIAEEFFRILSDFNIITLVGNHDSYLRDTSEISSINILKGWKNITVIDKITNFNIYNDTITLCPWGTKIEDIPSDSSMIFGHFEINTFNKNVCKMCENGINSTDLLKKSNLIISGHFHLREDRKYPNGNIIYVGCPYHQTWNDYNSTKGYYTLDLKTKKLDFFENTISPKFYKIKLSEIFDKTLIGDIKKLIPNNFIKIIVDIKIEFEKFEKIINSLALLKPLELSSDFTNENEIVATENCESVSLDIKNIISEFISNLNIVDIKDDVIKEIDEIYNSALNKVKIGVL